LLFSLPAQADIQVSLVPDNLSPSLGTELSWVVAISGVGSGTALGVFNVSVNFDPTALSYVQTIFGDPVLGDQLNLLGLGQNVLATPSTGSVDLIEFSLDDSTTLATLQATSFTLATLTFDTLAVDKGSLVVVINSLSDAYWNSTTKYTTQNSAVTITGSSSSSVLLLSALLLYLSGLPVLLRAKCYFKFT
jgi:hypothetical protein